MKRIVLYAVFCLSLVLFFSCSYNDLSTNDNIVSAEIIIDTTGIPVRHKLNIYDTLKISPKVSKAGTTGEQFKYKWVLSLFTSDNERTQVIGTERELKAPILLEPDAEAYRLWYVVTDTITSLQKDIIWEVEVSASSGQGIVVAYSRDGIDSDFDFVQSEQFSPQEANPKYKEGDPDVEFEQYVRNAYSSANEKKFKGIIKGMFFVQEGWNDRNTNFLFPYSDNSIERINALNYLSISDGKQMFYEDIDIQPAYLNQAKNRPFYVGGGKIYQRKNGAYFDKEIKFTLPCKGEYVANKFISIAAGYSSRAISFYDEVNGKFYSINYAPPYNFGANAVEGYKISDEFNPSDVKGFKVIGAGHYDSGNLHYFILRKGEETFIYGLNSSTGNADRIYNITAGTKMNQATDFIVCTNQKIIYYRVEKEIYAIIMGGVSLKYELKYTAPEEITAVKMYQGASEWIPTANEILMVATYNGDEGKLYALPLINMGTGNINQAKARIYKGFGKISFIGAQD